MSLMGQCREQFVLLINCSKDCSVGEINPTFRGTTKSNRSLAEVIKEYTKIRSGQNFPLHSGIIWVKCPTSGEFLLRKHGDPKRTV
jgi:hypothetical protein